MIGKIKDACFEFSNAPCAVVVDEAKSGAHNMCFDSEYLKNMQEDASLPPLLRLYSWQPFAVSLGRHQKETDVNAAACKKNGFDIVRRPTGGRAVLHAKEITYSLHIRLDVASHPQDIYRDIHLWIANGLEKLGASEIEFARHQPDFRKEYSSMRSAACFASSAKYELLWHGRKLVGSAQRIAGNILLQHGSILLASGHEEIVNVLNIDDESRSDLRSYLLDASVALDEITGMEYRFCDASEALAAALQ